MRKLILVIASVSIILCERAFAAPEIADAELRQASGRAFCVDPGRRRGLESL